ncbi:asparagine synthase (glutamine-hydrolyzing) [Rhizobium helianthi]|uniref:asparagine synthase (glutamine-hydrolyzing) n=1 Tax=Rhizobium helianthi TaxID=1132695 RepID=A0ABW4M8G8_9HYPH
MCGFAGYLKADIDPAEGHQVLTRMADAIAHRGPDERGFDLREADGLGLAHVRLSIVGLGDGQQPMHSIDGHLTIVFNGEIFNYIELREDLRQRGHVFRTASDTEVILALYAEYREDCLRHLNGDFAFALWDSRTKRLLLARDRIGVRPLFFMQHGKGIAFASEIKALFELPGVTPCIDPIAMEQIFTLWTTLGERTAFDGIQELQPGHMMIVEDGRTTTRAWWQLTYPRLGDIAPAVPMHQACEQARALLEDAIRLRLRADVPVGAYLSGGLDSSLICALASPLSQGPLNTFSVNFDSHEHDESSFQQQVAQALGTRHRSITCSLEDIANRFEQVVGLCERPILRTAPAPMYALSGLVQQAGMKVVLTGEGADEIFGGYDIFKEARLRRFCASQPKSQRRALLFRRLYPYLHGLQSQPASYLASFFGVGQDRLDDPLFSHRPRMRNTGGTKIFFSEALRHKLKDYDAAAELTELLPDDFKHWHPQDQAQYLEARYLLPGYILSAQGDRMAMAHGVEGRFPYLDHRVMEFAAELPPSLKMKVLTEKPLLREMAKGLLPQSIQSRPKQPYRAPDSAAFQGDFGRALVADLLSPDALATGGLFDPSAVAKLCRKAERAPLAGFRDNAAFIGILSTQSLLRRWVTNRKCNPQAA